MVHYLIMSMYCDAERLSTAFRFDSPFEWLQSKLLDATVGHRPASTPTKPEISCTTETVEAVGRLAVDTVACEPDEIVSSLTPTDNSDFCLISGPDNSAVTAMYLGPPDSLL